MLSKEERATIKERCGEYDAWEHTREVLSLCEHIDEQEALIERLKLKAVAVWLAASGDGCTVVQPGSEDHSPTLDKVNKLREERDSLREQLEAARQFCETNFAGHEIGLWPITIQLAIHQLARKQPPGCPEGMRVRLITPYSDVPGLGEVELEPIPAESAKGTQP